MGPKSQLHFRVISWTVTPDGYFPSTEYFAISVCQILKFTWLFSVRLFKNNINMSDGKYHLYVCISIIFNTEKLRK